nr:glycoside hydrolase family 9 protein [Methylobacterium sp. ZNC0032]
MFRTIYALVMSVLASAALAQAEQRPVVHEITIAAPDVVAVEIREPGFRPGRIVALARPAGESAGWINHDGAWSLVLGPKRTHLRSPDIPPATVLDRSAVDQAAEYAAIGGRKVVAVYRKSVPYDSGLLRGDDGNTTSTASFKHYVYLKLDRPLTHGDYAIRWPRQILPETRFAFDDARMRASAIRVNQNGYAPGDLGKIAYLALWLPGGPQGGAVAFADYGLKDFKIIDSDGRAVFTGQIALGRGPRDPEEGSGFPAPLIDYPSADRAPIRPSGVSPADPIAFTASGHGLKDGDFVTLSGFTGALARLNGAATVIKASSNQFALAGVDGQGLTAADDTLGQVTPAQRINRAGTFVYRLDFSAFRPEQAGDYHIQIAGLGVSDPFRVADDVWLKAARIGAAGLFHHRSGIALDGRFGYARPTAFRPGPELTLVQSKLPLAFSSEGGTGFLPFSTGAAEAWLDASAGNPDLWGGYMDAGDWDRRSQHLEVSYALMDLNEHAGPKAQSLALGLPKSSEVLDPKLYAGTDDLPDLLQEAIWNVDFFRRMQLPDGRVRGGIESASHPVLGEPSFLESQRVFVYAPDHVSGYRYAAAAAKLARILGSLQKPELAKLYRDSALAAWTAAEAGLADPDKFYAAALETMRKTNAVEFREWAARKAELQTAARVVRTAAAASLYRLTGEQPYRAVFEKAWTEGVDVASQGDGPWEYLQLPADRADRAIQYSIRQAFAQAADYILRPHATATYITLKNAYTPVGWGQGLAPDYNALQLLVRSHLATSDDRILRAMQLGSAHILGANQVGLSLTTGLGHRNVRHPLHEDHRAMGVAAPAGITLYGWAPQSLTSYSWIFGPAWAPLSDTAQRNGVAFKRVEPNRLIMPYYEYFIEYPGVVMQQEYTIHQSIGPVAALWIYLSAAVPRQP